MSNFSSTNKCPECYGNELRYWKDEPINPELVAYRDSYISPVKIYYADLNEALKAWGEEITPEEAERFIEENKLLGVKEMKIPVYGPKNSR